MVTDFPEFEAGVILEEVLGKSWRIDDLKGSLKISEDSIKRADEMLSRRLSGEPLQYIVGEWDFCGLRLKVEPGVLIPRQDTETLADTALDLIRDIKSPRVIDLCSGTGCVAIAIKSKRSDAEVYAVEKYEAAYEILKDNIKRYPGVNAVSADVLDDAAAAKFHDMDLITANPPYLTSDDMKNLQKEVTYEPKEALYGGDDGLRFYREIPGIWHDVLKDGGHIAFEIGLGQEYEVGKILGDKGYKDIKYINDLTGRARVVTARK